MEDNTTVEVTIFSHKLKIKSTQEDAVYLCELAEFVDTTMKDIAEKYGDSNNEAVIAILAMLNIADSLKKELDKNHNSNKSIEELKEQIYIRSSKLIELIDSNIE